MTCLARNATRGLLALAMLLLAGLLFVPEAGAYDQWSNNRDATNCRACHGDFRNTAYVSPSDNTAWGDDPHDIHRTVMLNSDCDTCHFGAGRFPVFTALSNGGDGFGIISCGGCHGREQDMGNDQTSAGRAAGLRQHHNVNGVAVCGDCHTDTTAADYVTVGEDVLPAYFFTPDAAHPAKPTDPCSPLGEEDFAGGADGLDNDGDNAYDVLDSDCTGPDFDADGIADTADLCETIVNTGTDGDMDGVDNACDTCLAVVNAPLAVAPTANRSLISHQRDDDTDGRGNHCDFDYNNAGVTVTSVDFNDMKLSVGKLMTASNCGAAAPAGSGNTQRCGEFDHDGGGATVTSGDFNGTKLNVGKTLGTKCAACTVGTGWSNVLGPGARLGRPVCQSAVAGACVYAP